MIDINPTDNILDPEWWGQRLGETVRLAPRRDLRPPLSIGITKIPVPRGAGTGRSERGALMSLRPVALSASGASADVPAASAVGRGGGSTPAKIESE